MHSLLLIKYSCLESFAAIGFNPIINFCQLTLPPLSPYKPVQLLLLLHITAYLKELGQLSQNMERSKGGIGRGVRERQGSWLVWAKPWGGPGWCSQAAGWGVGQGYLSSNPQQLSLHSVSWASFPS